jgi:sigma-E factor negative regulatory protein RseC
MEDQDFIEHEGTVREIREGKVIVSFLTKSACAHCQLKGVCSAADMADKEVEVDAPVLPVQPGEKVNIVLARSLGLRALAYGYLIPFVLLLATLFIVYELTGDEVTSGLLSLGVLVPYYLLLYLLRENIHRQFHFMIRKFD